MSININLTVAGQVSGQLSKAASALTAIQAPTTTANRTNVTGNERAKSSRTGFSTALQSISNALVKDGYNIHSVAKEFTAIDQTIKQQFDAISILSSPLTGGKK